MRHVSIITGLVAALSVGYGAAPANAQSWEELLAAGRKEGAIVVIGPVNPEARRFLTEAFEKDTGIKLSYEGLEPNTVPPRVEREAAASKITVDVLIGGSTELRTLMPKGLLAPIKPVLVLPEVTDVSKWQNGKLEFTDAEGMYMLRTGSAVYGGMVVNARNTRPDSIKKFDDLLTPEMKGKIVSSPVSSGSGSGFAANVLYRLKAERFSQLYKGQNVQFVANSRSVVEQVARGTYRVGVGFFPSEVEEFKKAGFPMEVIHAEDLPGYLAASWGTLKIVKNSPHPQAAAVFVNWFSTQKVQAQWSDITRDPSRRLDVNSPNIPSYMLVRPGIDYLDQHQYEFYMHYRNSVVKQAEELLGR